MPLIMSELMRDDISRSNKNVNTKIIRDVVLMASEYPVVDGDKTLMILSSAQYPVQPHTFFSPAADSKRAVVSYWGKYVHLVLFNRLGGRK